MDTRRPQRGQMLVLAAAAMAVMVLLVGMVIDAGYACSRNRTAQNAADFAALAGSRIVAQKLRGVAAATDAAAWSAVTSTAAANGTATVAAGSAGYVDVNGQPITTAGVTTGRSDCTGAAIVGQQAGGSIPSAARGVAVASASLSWQPFFLGIMGVSSWSTGAGAVARSQSSAQPACAFCVIGSAPPFTMQSGQTWLTVNGGAVGSNSGLDCSANANIVSTGTGSGVVIYGTNHPGNCNIPTGTSALSSPIPDPLAFLADPVATGPNLGAVTLDRPFTTTPLSPGIYSGLDIKSNATAQLAPGTYYFTGDVSIQANGALQGDGVTLVFMGPQTSFLPQSNATVAITAPPPLTTPVSATYPFPGMAIYFARDNKGTLQMQSSSTTSITGTIYAVNANALLDMQSGTTTSTINSMVVVGGANLQSSSKLTVNFSSSQNVQIPGGPPALVR